MPNYASSNFGLRWVDLNCTDSVTSMLSQIVTVSERMDRIASAVPTRSNDILSFLDWSRLDMIVEQPQIFQDPVL